MSVLVSAKAYLLGKTTGVLAPLLTGVTVTYSKSVESVPREWVYGGTVTGPVELKAFSGGVRVKQSEDLILMIHVRVHKPNTTEETVEARAAAIKDVIAAYIAANPTFGGLAELKLAKVSGLELNSWTDDDGAGATLDIAVSLMSYLT